MVYSSTKETELQEDETFITEDFIFFVQHLVLQELYCIYEEHKNNYGQMILALDNASGGYWRKDVFPRYKSHRKNIKEISPIKWDEVFTYINKLLQMITDYLPWKVVSVKRAEADDIMLVLSRQFNKQEKIMLHSPDKDMIQAQKGTDNVFQYSALTKKWLEPEHKHDDMEDWLLEHVCLGDSSDGVPRIIDETIFSENFLKYLKSNNVIVDNPIDFKEKLTTEKKTQLLQNYNCYKTNKKGEETELDIYFKERFGPSSLAETSDGTWELKQRKLILENKKAELKSKGLKITEINKEIKSLLIKDEKPEKRFNDWLDSHPTYRENYNRNYTLVMEDGIPVDIKNSILLEYKLAKDDLNIVQFEKFLDENNLSQLKMTMTFDSKKELTANDFGW
jgi:hypothetical protein